MSNATKNTEIEGSLAVGKHLSAGGNLTVRGNARFGHNVKIEGWLEAPNIKDINKGIFLTYQELLAHYPKPHDGWLAGVVETITDEVLQETTTQITAYLGIGGQWVKQDFPLAVNMEAEQLKRQESNLFVNVTNLFELVEDKTLTEILDLIDGMEETVAALYKVPGVVLTFLGEEGWETWRWDGESLEDWDDEDTWVDVDAVHLEKFATGEQVKNVGIDSTPTQGSDNLVKSGVVYEISEIAKDNLASISQKLYLEPLSVEDGKTINSDGTIRTNDNFEYRVFQIENDKNYAFGGYFSSGISAGHPFIVWFNENNQFIKIDSHVASGAHNVIYSDEVLSVPNGARYAYMNVQKSLSSYSNFSELVRIQSSETIYSRRALPSCDLNDIRKNGIWILNDSNSYQNVPNNETTGFLRVFSPDDLWVIQEYWNLTGSAYWIRRIDRFGVTSAWTLVNDKGFLTASINDAKIRAGLSLGWSSRRTLLTPTSIVENKFIQSDGTEKNNTNFKYKKYPISWNKFYAFTSYFSSQAHLPNITYFDINDNFLGYESPMSGDSGGRPGQDWIYQLAFPPYNAAYICLNAYTNLPSEGDNELYELDRFDIYNDTIVSKKALPSCDLNDIISNGFYLMVDTNTYANSPYGNTGFLLVMNTQSHWGIQEYYSLDGSIRFTRRWSSNGFLGWSKLNFDPSGLDNSVKELQTQDIKTNALISNIELMDYVSYVDNSFVKDDGTIGTNNNFAYSEFVVDNISAVFVTTKFANANISTLVYYDSNYNFLGHSISHGSSGRDSFTDELEILPVGTVYIRKNIQKSYGKGSLKKATTPILSQSLKDDIDAIKNSGQYKTKVVINSLDEPVSSVFGNVIMTDRFYIRAKYNSTKDIIIRHYYNGNGLVSFLDTYIGPKSLTDTELTTTQYLVSTHSDSTAPFFKVTEYWHLFAQHGYPIPRVSNPGMTSNDIGAIWKDQLNREYTIGRVTSSYVYLLPKIYQVDGHDVRDWKSRVYSDAITSLIHISGGSYTTTFTVSGYGQDQLRPIMQKSNRKFVLDGNEITKIGTYYGNELKISESAIGYDPASITNWFSNTGDNINPDNANPMAEFTFSYNYFGAQCCVNTTVHMLKELQCERYGAIQQQFFFDNGDYKAMFMLPKAAPQTNGEITVELDKPFNSPDSNSRGYDINRNSTQLKNVDDPVDRQIGYLHNPNTNEYLVGMAAGLSLISGDTITSKRIQNCEIGADAYHTLLTFSPSNINKMYIAAINTGKYQDHFFPAELFKEINYYVSYFDPAENVGQVYWYKDGGKYVIYCHCQTQETTLAINVPECMEGLSLSIVEKTNDTELLTDVITNGKFFVNYNTNSANYIVLIAK